MGKIFNVLLFTAICFVFSGCSVSNIQNSFNGETKVLDANTIQKYPHLIEKIENPTEDIQLIAVKENGLTLQYIKNPSYKVQLEAVKNNGYAIKYVINPSIELQLVAINDISDSIQYIKNPSLEAQLASVRHSGINIAKIENPNEEVQLEAVKQIPHAISFIKNPTFKMLLLSKREDGLLLPAITPLYFQEDNILIVSVAKDSVTVANKMQQFIKVNTMVGYHGSEIYNVSGQFTIPPKATTIIKLPQKYFQIKDELDLDKKIEYGFAIEYELSKNDIKNFYKIQQYKVKDILRDKL